LDNLRTKFPYRSPRNQKNQFLAICLELITESVRNLISLQMIARNETNRAKVHQNNNICVSAALPSD